MNINRIKNMFETLMRVDEIMKENGFTQEKVYNTDVTFFSHETLKIRAQLLTEDLNFYHLHSAKVVFSYKIKDFISDDYALDEKKFIEMIKTVKEKFLLESVSEDFK